MPDGRGAKRKTDGRGGRETEAKVGIGDEKGRERKGKKRKGIRRDGIRGREREGRNKGERQ